MASDTAEFDDMDSLFEGMVLFNPSTQQQVTASPNENEAPANNNNANNNKNNNNNRENEEQVIYNRSDSIISEESLVVSKPLDENLFSDLTLITPPSLVLQHSETLESHPSPNITTTITSASTIKPIVRQSSSGRKKKRATGLRIGYRKDELDSDPQPPSRLVREDVVVPPNKIETETRLSQPDAVDNRVEVDVVAEIPDAEIIEEGGESVGLVEGKAVEEVGVESGGSIELEFEKVRITVFENLKSVRELVASVSDTRKESIRRRRSAAESLGLASTRYRELERELEEACEAEDFEKADELSESLASADLEKEALAVVLRDADAECDAVDSKMQQVIDIQIAAEEECATLLRGFATDAANSAELVLKNAEAVSSNETNSWLSSVEATEVKRMELDIESHLVNEARLVLNDSVEHVVEDDKRERELLFKKKEELTDELEKLLALVKLKEAELAENEFSIEKVEKRIAEATSSFQEVQSSISTRYNSLQSGLLQMEEQNEALSTKKKEIDDFLSREEGRSRKIQELVKTSTDEANMYLEVAGLRKSLVQFILRSRKRKVVLAKTGDKLTEDVQMLKQEISNARASLQELSSTKTSIQQEIESFKQRLLFIDKRVPELEAEKKVAASVRNFKEAARIAAEAKALSVEKEGIQSKLDSALSEFGKLEEEISGTVNRLQDIEVQLLSKEKELAMTRFQILLLIAGAASSERSAALELGDVEEADILLGEAEVAEIEARKLQSTYSFMDEEFENLPKHFISMELVSNLGGEKLVELVASTQISSP